MNVGCGGQAKGVHDEDTPAHKQPAAFWQCSLRLPRTARAPPRMVLQDHLEKGARLILASHVLGDHV